MPLHPKGFSKQEPAVGTQWTKCIPGWMLRAKPTAALMQTGGCPRDFIQQVQRSAGARVVQLGPGAVWTVRAAEIWGDSRASSLLPSIIGHRKDPEPFGTPALKLHVPNLQQFLTLNSSEQKILCCPL